ncbi:TIGR03915 family putative DNA repair protein [Jejudonia soesokkakensis]|uniref:TIGR03915 family putative DNA repair protein n=1 Tax=Jejudonia soesokkakensis TaxID=1323432 RepID=A0ABW2MNR8_9FLAO
MRTILVYDETFEGFLSVVFYVFEYKLKHVIIQKESIASETFFDATQMVITEEKKADRVWKGLLKYIKASERTKLYKAYLSELPSIENDLLWYIQNAIASEKNIAGNFANPTILKISKIVKMVDREKHRMDAFVRFRLTKDDMYMATVSPDFNVLPLNAAHFKNRYADQRWLIYDLKRTYGIYYDLKKVTTVTLDLTSDVNTASASSVYFTEHELQYQTLWKNYFKSTNIESRKNMKLHVQHVPKRYWKYLSEKSPFS